MEQSNFVVIEPEVKHLGTDPETFEDFSFVGQSYCIDFILPSNLNCQEYAVMQCRTKNIQLSNKEFLVNKKQLANILEPHPNSPNEWMVDIAVVPGDWLEKGKNEIHIGYLTHQRDDFLIDNVVLFFKIMSD